MRLAVQRDFATLYSMAGRDYESIKLNEQTLEKNPNTLRPLFAASFRHMRFNDVEAADQYLKRVELLAPKRALDDRFNFCLETGDLGCTEEFGARYLELLRNEDSAERAEIFEAELSLVMGNPARTIELLEPIFEETSLFFVTRGRVFDILTLAIAYNFQGEIEKRDYVLTTAEERINKSLANGLWPRFVAGEQVRIAAISGDAGLTARRLALAIDIDARVTSREIDYHPAFNTVRDDPAVKQQRDRLQAKEDALRERLYAEGVWSKK